MRAASAIGRRDYAVAASLYEAIASQDPSDCFALSMLLRCNEHLHRHDAARVTARAILEKAPDDFRALCALGQRLAAEGHSADAYHIMGRVLQVSAPPTDPPPAVLRWLASAAVEIIARLRRRPVPTVDHFGEARALQEHYRSWLEYATSYRAWYEGQHLHGS